MLRRLPLFAAFLLALSLGCAGSDAQSDQTTIELDQGDDAAAAHYNLGVLELGGDPSAALSHFSAGRALDPEDPDYALGAARALAALGRGEEAAAALDEAEELAPDYPRIAEVRAELEGEGDAVNSLEGVQDKFGK